MQLLRDIGDMPDILRHVIAHDAVAAGQRPEQTPVPIGQANGRSVELQFTTIGKAGLQGLGSPFRELLDLADVIGVTQRQHRILMRILHELPASQVTADPAGGGILGRIFRIRRLQRFQLMHQLIIFIIRHGRRIVDIIAPAVLPKDSLEFFNPLLCFRSAHSLRARMYTRIDKYSVFCPKLQWNRPGTGIENGKMESKTL